MKRTRCLSHFAFFDADHDNKMVSLDVLDEGMGGGHRVLGAGFVVARYDIDEDEGQEDGLDEDAERQYIRLSRILRYFTRYWEANRYVIFREEAYCVPFTDMKKARSVSKRTTPSTSSTFRNHPRNIEANFVPSGGYRRYCDS